MFARAITRRHNEISCSRICLISSGEVGAGAAACWANASRRRGKSPPEHHLIFGQTSLGERWHVRQQGAALVVSNGHAEEGASLHLGDSRRQAYDNHVDTAGHRLGYGGGDAAERHVLRL